ncbi:helix-turn-helix domain-containing protein, partial [Chromobacterium vaccinii]
GEFSRRYPAVALDTDRIYIRQGNIWTAAGVSAGIDVALALVAEDMGEETARRCAQRLVVYYRRPGGQSQFSSLLEMQRPDGRFAALLDQVRRSLDGVWDVESLAGFCCLSPRHFSRLFQSEVGMPPAKAVEQLRVEAARAALESGERSIQKVARRCGFGDAERMRRSFLRVQGRQPSSLLRSPADE